MSVHSRASQSGNIVEWKEKESVRTQAEAGWSWHVPHIFMKVIRPTTVRIQITLKKFFFKFISREKAVGLARSAL